MSVTAPHSPLILPEEYLLSEEVGGQHDYLNGAVYAMAGATQRHREIEGNIFAITVWRRGVEGWTLESLAAPAAPIVSPSADCAHFFCTINAPNPGMKIGAETGIPCCADMRTWPISWTKMHTTNPNANHQPNANE